MEEVFAYADAEGVDLRIDGTEVQVRRPRAGRAGRKAFVSGKKKQNTIKTTTFSDHQGRTLFSGVLRPGRMHDQTALRTEGIAEQFQQYPAVKAEADSGYQGLAKEFPGQVSAPPKRPAQDACDGEKRAWREMRRRQSSARICVEHTNAVQRRVQAVAAPPAVHRTSGGLPRNPPGHRRVGLRPLRTTPDPPPDEHRTGPRPRRHPLIAHQPNHQANTPRTQFHPRS